VRDRLQRVRAGGDSLRAQRPRRTPDLDTRAQAVQGLALGRLYTPIYVEFKDDLTEIYLCRCCSCHEIFVVERWRARAWIDRVAGHDRPQRQNRCDRWHMGFHADGAGYSQAAASPASAHDRLADWPIDGVSLVPLFKLLAAAAGTEPGPPKTWNRTAAFWFSPNGLGGTQVSMLDWPWKYLHAPKAGQCPMAPPYDNATSLSSLLFRLDLDPSESHDLSDAQPEQLARMEAAVAARVRSVVHSQQAESKCAVAHPLPVWPPHVTPPAPPPPPPPRARNFTLGWQGLCVAAASSDEHAAVQLGRCSAKGAQWTSVESDGGAVVQSSNHALAMKCGGGGGTAKKCAAGNHVLVAAAKKSKIFVLEAEMLVGEAAQLKSVGCPGMCGWISGAAKIGSPLTLMNCSAAPTFAVRSHQPSKQTTSRQNNPGVVRIRTLQSDSYGQSSAWMLSAALGELAVPANGLCHTPNTTCPGFTGKEILDLIERLRPSQLERFVSGAMNMSATTVPAGAGLPAMTVLEFLNACQSRLAAGGEITVRASLDQFCCPAGSKCPHCDVDPEGCCNPTAESADAFLATTKQIYEEGQKLHVPWHTLGIDKWSGSCHAPPQMVGQLLSAVRSQGWTDVAVNEVGAVCDSHKLADTAEFGVHIDLQSQTVVPDFSALARIKAAGIRNAALYIDFPGQYATFDLLPVDVRAEALTNLSAMQAVHNFSFVYAVVQGHCKGKHCDMKCDATRTATTKEGPFRGATLFDVIAKLLAT
jgi:hypothetical protein